jgi:hypothetical protein
MSLLEFELHKRKYEALYLDVLEKNAYLLYLPSINTCYDSVFVLLMAFLLSSVLLLLMRFVSVIKKGAKS